MADSDTEGREDTTQSEPEEANDDSTESEVEEDGDDEESPSIEDEFRNLFAEADAESRRLKGIAMKAEQSGDPSSAAVLREVAGGVVQLIQDLIATCGGAFQDVESMMGDEDGSRLDDEDAEKLHGLLLACRKLVTELLAAGAAGDSRVGLETLISLLDDQIGFVLDVSDYEPEPSPTTN